MPTITGPILDSSGRPASGLLRVRASAPFSAPGGLVTQAAGVATVRAGTPYGADGDQWSLPATPPGVVLLLEQDLDGEHLQRYQLTVPESTSLTYTQLLFNRAGEGAGGPEPYMWDLTGGLDFPPGAVPGDFGWDRDTDQIWRYEP